MRYVIKDMYIFAIVNSFYSVFFLFSLFVHSAVSQWRRCLHSIKLKDSILAIV